MVTSTKLVGDKVLMTLCAMCRWTNVTVLRSSLAANLTRQHKRHAQGVAKHAALDHGGETPAPNSMATRWPVARDGYLHDRCHRCHYDSTSSASASSAGPKGRRQQLRHKEKVEAHVCRSGIPEPTKRPLPVIGRMRDSVLNKYSRAAQQRLNWLHPNDRVS